MASCITTQWGNAYSPQVRLTVVESASTGGTSTLSWTLEYLTKGYAAETVSARPYTVTINGETVKSGTYDINGKAGSAYTIATGTKVIDKTTSSQTISFGLSFEFHVTWSGVYTGVKTASGSITVAAKTSYTVSYNANGGSGAPSSQTKWYGAATTLSSIKPSRTGYTFQGWATSASGGVAYAAGASYTANANATLYAVWKANTYTVSFNANGGSGAPSSQTKTYGVTLTLSSTKPTRTNYTFKGWSTSSTATTATYAAGGNYTANAAATLYAVWELAYVKPRISNLSIVRCTSSGTVVDDGTNALVSFNWECDYTVASITIEWKLSTSSTWSSVSASASGTSGTVSKGIGSNGLDAESTYNVRITVADSGGQTSVTGTVPTIVLVIDALAGGKGVAFGKVAELENTADFAFKAKFNAAVYGNALGLNELPAIPSNSDLNDYLDTGCWGIRSNATAETLTNIPLPSAGRLEVFTSLGSGVSLTDWVYLRQKFIPYDLYYPTYERDIIRKDDDQWTYYPWRITSLHGQKVLWSGGLHMHAEQIITLPALEPISAQPNGIVLVWSYYDGTTVCDYSWNRHFVSKHEISLLNGGGSTFFMGINAGFSSIAAKYLFFTDTSISGHSGNTSSGTNSGITFDNSKYVLRYVIGV